MNTDIENLWESFRFKLNNKRNRVIVDAKAEIFQYREHPRREFRVRPEYAEWFDDNIEGEYHVFFVLGTVKDPGVKHGVGFSNETDAMLFKLTFG